MAARHRARALALALVLPACSSGAALSVGVVAERIVAGDPDTTHQSVVYVGLTAGGRGGGSCTGTIVQADPTTHIGYVLTAAHCLDGLQANYVAQGDDVAKPGVYYDVLDQHADPGYPAGGHDVALLRVVGVDETTPTTPFLGPKDPVPAIGAPVLAVGYGRTSPNAGVEWNTVRHRLAMTVVALESGQLVLSGYGNPCAGDSGGPVLVGVPGSERVAAVETSADPSCYFDSNATLVQPAFEAELRGFLEEAVPESCQRCTSTRTYGHGDCADITARCAADEGCQAARSCVSGCDADPACESACVNRASASLDLYFERAHCSCDPCAAACADPPSFCSRLPELERRRAAALSGESADAGASGANRGAGTDAGAGAGAARASGASGGGCSVRPVPAGRTPARLAPWLVVALVGLGRRTRRRSGTAG